MAEPIYLHRTIHETLAETRRLVPKALNKIVSRNLGSIMSGAQNTRERHPSGPRAAPSVENTLLESRNGKLSVRDLPRYPAMFVDDFTCPFYVYSNAELDQMMPRRKMGRVRPPRRDPDFWHCCSCAVRPCVPLHRWECLIPGCGDVYPLCRHKVCLEHMGEHPWCNDCCVVWSGIEAGYMHKRAGDWLDHLQQERVEGWARRDDWVANNPEKAQWRKYYMVVLELKGVLQFHYSHGPQC